MSTIVCVFAHPDDEAFGPGGTIAKLARENNVYIICVTDGDAGKSNGIGKKELGEIRRNEMQRSSKVLGVKKIFFLGYHDGTLCNNIYQEIAEKIKKILLRLHPEKLITFEKQGATGHLDHIAVSYITTFLFHKVPFIKKIWYFCNSSTLTDLIENYFIYFPIGYEKKAIDVVMDITDVWDTKIKAMNTHQSQKEDLEWWKGLLQRISKEECFIVKEK